MPAAYRLMLLSVGTTVIRRLLVAESPLPSTIVTETPYVPASLKVSVSFFAALLPLTLNVADPPWGRW